MARDPDCNEEEMAIRVRLSVMLKHLRAKYGESQTDLADLIGMKRQYIVEVETARRNLPTYMLLRIARHYEVPMELIVAGRKGDL